MNNISAVADLRSIAFDRDNVPSECISRTEHVFVDKSNHANTQVVVRARVINNKATPEPCKPVKEQLKITNTILLTDIIYDGEARKLSRC